MKFQQLLFKKISKKIPNHSSVEYEIAPLLGIDMKEAYQIVRGQKELSLNQAFALSKSFGISLEGLEENHPTVIPFQFNAFDYNIQNLSSYFEGVLAAFLRTDLFGRREMIYAASEFPLFTIFQFPELAAFKLFFWGKTVYELPEFKNQQFSVDMIPKETLQLGEQAWRQYLKFHSIEIWSSNIVNDILTQIYFLWQHRHFKTKRDALIVCEKVSELLIHVEQQAVLSRKFHPKLRPPKEENFELYYNDVSVSNNTIWVNTLNQEMVFVSQNALNYLVSDHPIFYMQTERWLKQLIKGSVKITGKNANLRHNFFARMNTNVDFVKRQIDRER